MLGNPRKNRTEVRHVQKHILAGRGITDASQARGRLRGPPGELRLPGNGHDAPEVAAGAVHKAQVPRGPGGAALGLHRSQRPSRRVRQLGNVHSAQAAVHFHVSEPANQDRPQFTGRNA